MPQAASRKIPILLSLLVGGFVVTVITLLWWWNTANDLREMDARAESLALSVAVTEPSGHPAEAWRDNASLATALHTAEQPLPEDIIAALQAESPSRRQCQTHLDGLLSSSTPIPYDDALNAVTFLSLRMLLSSPQDCLAEARTALEIIGRCTEAPAGLDWLLTALGRRFPDILSQPHDEIATKLHGQSLRARSDAEFRLRRLWAAFRSQPQVGEPLITTTQGWVWRLGRAGFAKAVLDAIDGLRVLDNTSTTTVFQGVPVSLLRPDASIASTGQLIAHELISQAAARASFAAAMVCRLGGEALPVDPTDPENKPLRVQALNGGKAERIYACGGDGQDNGGNERDLSLIIMLPPPAVSAP
jgi:hypothetical protein